MNDYAQCDNFARNAIRYGKIIRRQDFETDRNFWTIRIVVYVGWIWYHRMLNGEMVECTRLAPYKEFKPDGEISQI